MEFCEFFVIWEVLPLQNYKVQENCTIGELHRFQKVRNVFFRQESIILTEKLRLSVRDKVTRQILYVICSLQVIFDKKQKIV